MNSCLTSYRSIVLNLGIFSFIGLSAQGILNNGANIVLNTGATVYINGTTGHYKNQNLGLIKSNTAGGTINMFGNWTNNAANIAFQNDGANVMLSGADQTIGGSNSTSFYNLTLAGSGTKSLTASSTVGGQSTFTGVLAMGDRPFDLNGNRLNISNSSTAAITYSNGYIISETNAAINSSILNWKTGTNTGSYIFPFGVSGTQIPVTFSITSGMATGTDNVSIATRATSASNNSPWAGASNVSAVSNMKNSLSGTDGSAQAVIDRWWDITPSAAVTANVTFRYRGAENTLSSPYNAGSIGAQHWNGTNWEGTVGSATAVTSGTGTVTANGLKSFSPYILSASLAPLPIELLNFDYSCDGKSILFKWCTATETNNDHFTLWYSTDAVHFEDLATVPGQGNSTTKKCYDFILENGRLGNSYFKLSQTDFDGTNKEFKMIHVDDCFHPNELITIKNVGSNQLEINIEALGDNYYELQLNNTVGQCLIKKSFQILKGNNVLTYDLSGLAKGIYYARFYSKEKSITKKILIN